jgi:hypothetical protein
MDKRLSMSAYLAFNVESGVEDAIEVHVPTWMGIFFIFGTYCVLGRYAKVELSHYIPFFIFLCLLFVLLMHLINRHQHNAIRSFQKQQTEGESNFVELLAEDQANASSSTDSMTTTLDQEQKRKWFQHAWLEKNLLRMLQIVVFFLTYTLADTLADKHKWKDRFNDTLVFALVYLVIYIFMVAVIPRQLPIFLQLTALPPFLDEANLNMLLHVVLDDHVIEARKEESIGGSVSSGLAGSAASTQASSSQNREFAAVVELADVIGQCSDFEKLARVRQSLEERMQTFGITPATYVSA